MTPPMVTVMREQKVRAWPDAPDGGPRKGIDDAYVLPLDRALTREYRTDAHFCAYATPLGRRLSKQAAGHVPVRLDVIVVDVDCAEAHGTGKPAPDTWRVETRTKVMALLSSHPGGVYFETRGGARLIYRLPVPATIIDDDDAMQWRQDYVTTLAYLDRVYDIQGDPACSDWTRLFRCPRAVRTPGAGPEPWPIIGDPSRVQSLWFSPSDEDLERAREILPKAFGEIPLRTRRHDGAAPPGGIVYNMLRNRGHVIAPYKAGTYLIRCPNEGAHTGGRPGDTSTILYPPGPGQRLGHIHCLHAHCSHMTAREWLQLFGWHERMAAEND